MKDFKVETSRVYFSFMRSYIELLDDCPQEDLLAMLQAILAYGLRREEPEPFKNPLTRFVWKAIRQGLEGGWIRYLNGLKGGAPEGNTNAQKQSKNNLNSIEKQGRLTKNKNKIKKKNKNKNIDINREINLSLYILKEEQKKFYEELKQYREIYGDEMLTSFYATWAEPTKDGIMRKDEEKSWSTPLRLAKYQVKLRKGGNA